MPTSKSTNATPRLPGMERISITPFCVMCHVADASFTLEEREKQKSLVNRQIHNWMRIRRSRGEACLEPMSWVLGPLPGQQTEVFRLFGASIEKPEEVVNMLNELIDAVDVILQKPGYEVDVDDKAGLWVPRKPRAADAKS